MKVSYEKFNIYDHLKNNAYKNNILFQAEIDVTYSCNAKCFFCFQGNEHINKNKILSYDEICDLIDQLKNMGCFYVGFSGGEPFMRKDFINILRYAKKKGFIVSLVSNLQIPDNRQIAELAEIGIDRITVSCHSVNYDNYCKIFKVSMQECKRAFNNIEFLINRKNPIGIASTISLCNYYEMSDIVKYFQEMGLDSKDINFNMLIQGKNDILGFRENENFRNYLSEHKELKNNILSKNKCYLCSAGRISCTISPFGDVFPCTFFNASAGNIKKNRLKDIWHNSHLLKIIRSIDETNFDKCFNCTNKNYCHICMANNMNETSVFNTPSKEYCEFRKNLTFRLLGE